MKFDLKQIVPISLVIPCLATCDQLLPLMHALYASSVWPKQIIVVNVLTTVDQASCISVFASSEFAERVTFVSTDRLLYPGEARNYAIPFVKCELLAFLDVNTLPTFDWLESTYSAVASDNLDVIFGKTQYCSDRAFEQSVIDSTFGRNPVTTLPGSMMTIWYFNCVGHFLPKIRSGEDTDWLIRSNHFLDSSKAYSTPLLYNQVPKTYAALFVKWFRNYSSCAPICFHLQYQRAIYVFAGSLVAILIAYNWNSVIASWDFDNPFYTHNITKIVSLLLIFLYFAFRGIYLPLVRGVPLRCLLPFRFMRLGLICLVIDISKLLAFLTCRV